VPPSSIDLIAVDVDATLLNDRHELTARTETAIKAAMARGVQVTIATGKTPYSTREILPRLGLASVGPDGVVHSQEMLSPEVVQLVAGYVEREGLSLVGYSGGRIVTGQQDAFTDTMAEYHERPAEVIGSLSQQAGQVPINKILVMSQPERLPRAREDLTAQLDGQASLVSPLDYILEVLPPGASKGTGLRRLLDELGIDPARVMAIGDGENDVEMLRLAGIGVAVGNAMPVAKAAADVVVGSNNDDGVAEAIERFVLGVKG
jgi:Cof subfamily protein (haloacid dehalogenase superfamily)